MHNYFTKFKLYLIDLPLIAYWLLILLLTSLPSSDVPNVNVNDKIQHFLAYFGLGFLGYLELTYQNKFALLKKHAFVSSIILCAFYAGLDEIHQYFIPGRFMDFFDWQSDVIGSVFGIFFIWFVLHYEKRLKSVEKVNGQ